MARASSRSGRHQPRPPAGGTAVKPAKPAQKQRQQLVSKLATASPGDVLAIQAQLSALTTTQTEYERQLSDLDLAFLASSKAVLLDPVRQPTVPLPKDTAQKAVLVGLIGALLGLGLAALLEALSPRLPSPRAISRALDVPRSPSTSRAARLRGRLRKSFMSLNRR